MGDSAGKDRRFLQALYSNGTYINELGENAPVGRGNAMIREVHVYGQVANLHKADGGVQHLGLGSKLIERACEIARAHGYDRVNVISSVGTREYYRRLGFRDGELYQTRMLG